MKMFATALSVCLAVGLIFISQGSSTAQAKGAYAKSGHAKSRLARRGFYARRGSRDRSFSQREFDTLPISVTRPPNTSHFNFQGVPFWAAHAFQPNPLR